MTTLEERTQTEPLVPLMARLDTRTRDRRRVIRVKPRVLLAEDDPHLRALLALTLERAGMRVVQACDGLEAVDRIVASHGGVARRFGAIVADVRMPRLSGLDVLTVLRCSRMETPVILMSAFADDDVRAEARGLGAAATFAKPFDLDALVTAVAGLVHRRRFREVA